jgi:phosphoribosylamine--glycine ligase
MIGNGAREHVVVEAFKQSKKNPKVFSYMKANNPGIAELSEKILVGKYDDFKSIMGFAKENHVDFAFIGPEDPIEKGLVDELEKNGIRCVAPKKILGQLETSKSFTRKLLTKYGIPGNPEYKIFTKESELPKIEKFLETIPGFVIKPDGLTGGKGVKVQGDHIKTIKEALDYCKEVLKAHDSVVIEEKLVGEEFSLQCLTDGKTVLATPPAQDHKRAFVDDTGPNTGGMGSYSDADHLLPFLPKRDIEDALRITQMVAHALKEETGELYKGVMYGGWIATDEGIRLIEFNARFGDPEAMNVLPLLKTDLVEICQAIIDEKLDKIKVEFEKKATVCKYVVPEGYPTNPVSGKKIIVAKNDPGVKMYYASVEKKGEDIILSSSRAIAFVGISKTISEAEKMVERAIDSIKGPVFHRPDIGTDKLIQKRIDHMKKLRPNY